MGGRWASCRRRCVTAVPGSVGTGGGGSLRGLVNVRPDQVALDARGAFNALGQFNAGAANAGKDLAQKSGRNAQFARKSCLGQIVLADVKGKGVHEFQLAEG